MQSFVGHAVPWEFSSLKIPVCGFSAAAERNLCTHIEVVHTKVTAEGAADLIPVGEHFVSFALTAQCPDLVIVRRQPCLLRGDS